MLTTISPRETAQKLRDGVIRLIDVRESNEYLSSSIAQSENVPLSIIGKHPINISAKPIVFTCQSGKRTAKNAQLLKALAKAPAQIMEGGINAWDKEKLPLFKACGGLSIFRQVQIGAGLLIILSFITSVIWPVALWLCLFVGAGLFYAGISGFCGMGIILEKMPWNKNDKCKLIQ